MKTVEAIENATHTQSCSVVNTKHNTRFESTKRMLKTLSKSVPFRVRFSKSSGSEEDVSVSRAVSLRASNSFTRRIKVLALVGDSHAICVVVSRMGS